MKRDLKGLLGVLLSLVSRLTPHSELPQFTLQYVLINSIIIILFVMLIKITATEVGGILHYHWLEATAHDQLCACVCV